MRTNRLALWLALAGAALASHASSQTAPAPSDGTKGGPAMKAVRIHSFGGRETLAYEDAPTPAPKAGEMLVRVRAAGVNPVDWKIRSGAFPFPKEMLPMILGYDVGGVVESAAPDVTAFKKGDEIYAYVPLQRGGGYAQFAIVKPEEAALKPKKASFEQAGATPLAALTAWQALFDTAGLTQGQSVLIHAGAGGVGHFAVQLAKAKGAKVYATASGANQAFLKELGADVCIDYTAQKFEEVATGMDVVFDMIGGETQARSMACLKPGGFLVSIVQPPSPEKLKERGLRGGAILVKPSGAQLAQIGAMIDAGTLKPYVSDALPLKDAAKAHELSETGRTRGKIVLKPE